jgi:hypothetical protein
MKNKSIIFLIFSVLVTFIFLTGCTQPQGTSDTNHSENKTAVAIGIALNSSSVRTYLTEPWVITDVNFNATTSIAGGGQEEVTLHTPDVVIDSKSRVLHVYVDVENKSVINIWNSPKRVPYP